MGNCCGYLRVATNVTVSEPAMLEAIKSKCEIEVKEQERRLTPAEKAVDHPKAPTSNNNSSSQENIEKHGTCPKEDTNNKDDPIVIKKVEEKINLEVNTFKGERSDDDSPSKRKTNNLNPAELAGPHRRGSKSNTSINNMKNVKKQEPEAEKKIDINELKLSGRLIERIEKFHALGGRRKNREATRVFLRSMTLGGDGLSELVEMEEKEEDKDDDKTKEEITKELKENKETIERNHKRMTLIKQQDEVKNHLAGGGGENGQPVKKKKVGLPKKKAAEEPVPGKSLLKKYRTIGDDKKKKKGKKVKFQDLVDKKKKKKAQNKF